jgi:NAD(P)-dependent dehydrogenase (short-subunit alcohol dehydrogenase family)
MTTVNENWLCDRIAIVAGATRGAGRGIARMLGEAGATVYCTGRSARGAPATPGRQETIEETADLVNSAGGRSIAIRVDHSDAGQVQALFERVRTEAGGLDILVNDIWGGDELTQWQPFWTLDPAKRIPDARPGGAHAYPHQPLRRAADGRPAARPDRGSHRRRP